MNETWSKCIPFFEKIGHGNAHVCYATSPPYTGADGTVFAILSRRFHLLRLTKKLLNHLYTLKAKLIQHNPMIHFGLSAYEHRVVDR